MDARSKKIFEELRDMELESLKDVELTAKKINLNRRQKIIVNISTEYPKINETEKYSDDIKQQTIITKHIKNGSFSECA